MNDKSNVCIVCINPVNKLVSLSDIKDFYEKFKYVTSINILEKSKYPDQVCVLCLKQLYEAESFIKKSQKSYNELSSWNVQETKKDYITFRDTVDSVATMNIERPEVLVFPDTNNNSQNDEQIYSQVLSPASMKISSPESFEIQVSSPYRQTDIPIKKRFLPERKEDTIKRPKLEKPQKVLDIEDIVPAEGTEKQHKTGCEGCCLESTNVCLQKINTNLNPNDVPVEDTGCGSSSSTNMEVESQNQPNFTEDQGYFSSPSHLLSSSASENLAMDNPVDFEETVKLEGLKSDKIVDAEMESFAEPNKFDGSSGLTDYGNFNTTVDTFPVVIQEAASYFPCNSEVVMQATYETSEISENLKTLNLSEDYTIVNLNAPLNLKVTENPNYLEISDSDNEKPSTDILTSAINCDKKESIFTIHCDEPNCKYSFKNEENKKIHKILYHSNLINESNQCIYCDKTFARKRLLKRHLFLHLKIYQYFCKYCQKGFKLKHQLKNHESLHERSEELIISKTRRSRKIDKVTVPMDQDAKALGLLCQHCGSTFSTKGALKAHLKRCDTENG